MRRTIGGLEAQVIAYSRLRRWRTVRTGDLLGPLGLNAGQERALLSRMARAGLIARVWRGLYLVPQSLPLGGKWSPSATLALTTLVDERGGRYQICGPNAFSRYGFDPQIPNRIFAYNNRLWGRRTIGSVELTLIRVSDERLGATESVETPDEPTAIYSSRARALVDAVYDWSRFNGLPRAYRWILSELASGRVAAKELVALALKFGDRGTKRRIGFLLSRAGVPDRLLSELRRDLPATSSPIPWIPTLPKRGPADRVWGVVMNGEV